MLTVAFNPLLAIVNGHLHPLGNGAVVAVQAAMVAAAFAVGLLASPPPLRWVLLAWALALNFAWLSLLRGAVQLKDLGDALLIPAFVGLGTAVSARALVRATGWLQLAIGVIGLWELLNPAGFGGLFKVRAYYEATRGFSTKEFWAGGDLFVSSVRGGGRMLLPGTGFHRGSSLFLEPVSLGNWAVVTAIVLAASWSRLTARGRALSALGIATALFVCDGRLALGVCLLLAAWLPVARRIEGRWAALYLPLVLLVLALASTAGLLPQSGDTLSGRLRGGFDLLTTLDGAQLFGVGGLSRGAVDAGWVYLVETQSVIAALGLWLVLMLTDTGASADDRAMKHGIGLFVALCLPITYAILSIKTSALMWALYGQAFQRVARARGNNASETIVEA